MSEITLGNEVKRRRTFAIIAHPDAGKTTLTEKLLLFGGAIQLAGEVKAKKDKVQTRSDWMKLERERGISVVTSVMTFEYEDVIFNLLDTPGHEDFADDTYRTLTAVDGAIMVLDAAKGIEARTLKLFEVCRARNLPIITFINKMDREAQDPFALLDEIEDKLVLETAPMHWPIGFGKNYVGTYDFRAKAIWQKDEQLKPNLVDNVQSAASLLPENERDYFCENVNLAETACREFCKSSYLAGHMTPVYFGSALRNYGVRALINALISFFPAPQTQPADKRLVQADEEKMTGFVFKIQANMDPNHRDRIAFFRVCSGVLKKGMKAFLVRTKKNLPLSAPQFFFAQARQIAEEAYAGDVIGIPNHGTLRIGDSLTEGEDLLFQGVPNFAPEILRRVQLSEALKAKKLKEALFQMAQEGVVQLFLPEDGSSALIGVVGALQLDVLSERLKEEYSLPVRFEQPRFSVCRWISSSDKSLIEAFVKTHLAAIAKDLDGDYVYLAENGFSLNYEMERAPNIEFFTYKDYQKRS